MGVGGAKAHAHRTKVFLVSGAPSLFLQKKKFFLRATSDQMDSFDPIKLLAKIKS
jgi:hypothetical protein